MNTFQYTRTVKEVWEKLLEAVEKVKAAWEAEELKELDGDRGLSRNSRTVIREHAVWSVCGEAIDAGCAAAESRVQIA